MILFDDKSTDIIELICHYYAGVYLSKSDELVEVRILVRLEIIFNFANLTL